MTRQDKAEVLRLLRLLDEATDADGEIAGHRDGVRREYYQGRLREVVDASRSGWWRFHKHYDRDGYCDNPARGY